MKCRWIHIIRQNKARSIAPSRRTLTAVVTTLPLVHAHPVAVQLGAFSLSNRYRNGLNVRLSQDGTGVV